MYLCIDCVVYICVFVFVIVLCVCDGFVALILLCFDAFVVGCITILYYGVLLAVIGLCRLCVVWYAETVSVSFITNQYL